jgi:hypothetical protein
MAQSPKLPIVTRQIVVDAQDPLAGEIKQKVLESERRGESPGCFVNQDFIYDDEEIARASLFRMRPMALLRTFGQRHGTVYDETNACTKCGAGRIQQSPLVIDPRYLTKKKKDFLVTITADEWLVSAKFANLIENAGVQNCSMEPIHDLRGRPLDDWFQLKVNAVFGSAAPPTKFGVDYFHDDTSGEYVCRAHCLSGLNLVSELYVHCENRALIPELSKTNDRVGRKDGWIVPAPLLLISRGFADAIMQRNVRGVGLDVAYIV